MAAGDVIAYTTAAEVQGVTQQATLRWVDAGVGDVQLQVETIDVAIVTLGLPRADVDTLLQTVLEWRLDEQIAGYAVAGDLNAPIAWYEARLDELADAIVAEADTAAITAMDAWADALIVTLAG